MFIRRLVLSLFTLVAVTSYAQERAPIVVGQTYVGSGPLAGLSTEPLLGIRAMVNTVNQSGGIRGQQIKLLQLDDASKGDSAEANVRQFMQDKAVAVLMPIGTVASVGALKAANELRIPVIGAYSGAGPVAKPTPYAFPSRISFEEEYRRIVNHLLTVGHTRVAFAYNDNPGAKSAMEATQKILEQRGQTMLGSVAIKQDGSDAAAKAAELAALKPNVVLLSTTNLVAGELLKAYRPLNRSTLFYSFSFLNGTELFKAIGPDAVGVKISQVVPSPWNTSIPIVAEYQKAMRALGQNQFGYGSLEGYVNAKILVSALRKAGSNPTAEAVTRALESFETLDLGGLEVRYDAKVRTGLRFSDLTMLRSDGRYTR
jgi:branched-chain amino acid transport system substrate-binding protein